MAAEAMALRFSSRHRGSLLLAGLGLAVFGARCAWIALAGAHVPALTSGSAKARACCLPCSRAVDLRPSHPAQRAPGLHREGGNAWPFPGQRLWDVKGGLVVSAAAKAAEMGAAPPRAPAGAGGNRSVVDPLAAGVCRCSSFDLLSGLQISFTLMEIASVLALQLLLGRRTLDGDCVAAAGCRPLPGLLLPGDRLARPGCDRAGAGAGKPRRGPDGTGPAGPPGPCWPASPASVLCSRRSSTPCCHETPSGCWGPWFAAWPSRWATAGRGPS